MLLHFAFLYIPVTHARQTLPLAGTQRTVHHVQTTSATDRCGHKKQWSIKAGNTHGVQQAAFEGSW
jgi:hypothetical protein